MSIHESSASYWLQDFLAEPSQDMGLFDLRLKGIYTPLSEVGLEKIGITSQFLADADIYDAKYGDSEHFKKLFRLAFSAVGYVPGEGLDILDLGAGSGVNSTIPCLELFQDSRVVASDLSPDLLRILQAHILRNSLGERVACLCADAMKAPFREEKFDVVVGASILHHLRDPSRAISTSARVLRPGGRAYFFEPFEGFNLIRVAYTMILDRADREGLTIDSKLASWLRAMCIDYEARTGIDKSDDKFKYMDDKWLFTRHYIEAQAERAGFSSVTVVPDAFYETCFADSVASDIRVGVGLPPSTLPKWGWEIINLFDRSFSPEMKRDLSLECVIVFRK